MIAEKNGITVDTRTAAPARKMIKCPQKTGINLNLQEDRQRDRRTLLIGILAIAALVTVVVNFGVLQQYRRLDKAQAAYDRVHTQYVSAQEALADYDRVLLEYRTYSMDWMTAAGSEDIPAAVDRQAALDLLEQEMLSHGSLTALQITQNTMNVDMSGMTLDQISAMFARLRLSPIVDSVSLSVASTEEGKAATIMDEEESFTEEMPTAAKLIHYASEFSPDFDKRLVLWGAALERSIDRDMMDIAA